jgi:hypothetical protein
LLIRLKLNNFYRSTNPDLKELLKLSYWFKLHLSYFLWMKHFLYRHFTYELIKININQSLWEKYKVEMIFIHYKNNAIKIAKLSQKSINFIMNFLPVLMDSIRAYFAILKSTIYQLNIHRHSHLLLLSKEMRGCGIPLIFYVHD